MSSEEIKKENEKPARNKKTPFAVKHESPIIVQLPKYNLFLSIKTNVNNIQIGLDKNGEVIRNKVANIDGEFDPIFVGIQTKPVVTILTAEEVKDHLSIYQHD